MLNVDDVECEDIAEWVKCCMLMATEGTGHRRQLKEDLV